MCVVALGFSPAQAKDKNRIQAGLYTPAPGSSETRAILDVMRLDFYSDAIAAHRNSEGIFFKVLFLKVHGDWALTFVQPVNADEPNYAEPRWELLHRKGVQWFSADYIDALGPYMNDDAVDDALDMTASTIRKLWRKFPDAPKDIFPDLSKQPSSIEELK